MKLHILRQQRLYINIINTPSWYIRLDCQRTKFLLHAWASQNRCTRGNQQSGDVNYNQKTDIGMQVRTKMGKSATVRPLTILGEKTFFVHNSSCHDQLFSKEHITIPKINSRQCVPKCICVITAKAQVTYPNFVASYSSKTSTWK